MLPTLLINFKSCITKYPDKCKAFWLCDSVRIFLPKIHFRFCPLSGGIIFQLKEFERLGFKPCVSVPFSGVSSFNNYEKINGCYNRAF